MAIFSKLCALVLFLLSVAFSGVSQDYGLKFDSHETVVDQRTTLQLADQVCIDESARLDFHFKFAEGGRGYFGYLVRMVTSDGLNIDLIFKPSSPNYKFNLVVGKRLRGVKFDLANVYEWNHISVILDIAEDQVQVIAGDTTVMEREVGFGERECVEVVFGRSSIPGIRSIDLPPMTVRDIRLSIDNELLHHWPLNETEGTLAYDSISGVHAHVVNPNWSLQDFQKWRLHRDLKFDGPVTVAFNSKDETILILSNDSLTHIPLIDGQMMSSHIDRVSDFLFQGDQGTYYEEDDVFVNINLTQRRLAFFDIGDSSFKADVAIEPKLCAFWHHGKVINPADTSIVMIGGYGNLTYKNLAQRYDIRKNEWDTLRLQGDTISPRYLFGLGNSESNTSYLIGGYGSATGDQLLYPQTYLDLYRIDWTKLYVEKIYELPEEEEPFVFANSIVIDDDSSFYGLTFPRFKFKSHLQLIRGSLLKPEYGSIGDSISFSFHDINSFADLFHAKKNGLLVAVTTYLDAASEQTSVRIHTISFPPIAGHTRAYDGQPAENKLGLVFFIVGGLLLAAMVFYITPLRRFLPTRRPHTGDVDAPASTLEKTAHDGNGDSSQVVLKRDSGPPAENHIRFFGGFYVFGKDGTELTNRFTPLLKELFLLIALNSLKHGKGISPQKLDEILWFDKTEKSARNNRSVNITKLKLILNSVGIDLSKRTGYWKINVSEAETWIDYAAYLAIVDQKKVLNRAQIDQLIPIIANGAFLHNLQYQWLDSFKSAVSTEIITLLNAYLKAVDIGGDGGHVIDVIKCIYIFDPVDEEAMNLECRALFRMGNHTLAKDAYEKFRKEYFTLYGEDYGKSFQAVIDG